MFSLVMNMSDKHVVIQANLLNVYEVKQHNCHPAGIQRFSQTKQKGGECGIYLPNYISESMEISLCMIQ